MPNIIIIYNKLGVVFDPNPMLYKQTKSNFSSNSNLSKLRMTLFWTWSFHFIITNIITIKPILIRFSLGFNLTNLVPRRRSQRLIEKFQHRNSTEYYYDFTGYRQKPRAWTLCFHRLLSCSYWQKTICKKKKLCLDYF